MGAGLLSALLGLALVQMTPQGLDLQKMVGFWWEAGVASRENLALKTPRRLEALFLTLSGETLTVTVAYNNSGSCQTEEIVSSEMNVLGKFVFPGRREIHVMDTDYEQYAILRVSLQWQNNEFYVFKYFTRSLGGECEPGFLKFRELTTDMGLYLVGRHGMWYEIALASNLEHQSSSPGRKMGAVIVEQDGPHLGLTSVSDHMNLCMKEKNQAVKGDAPGKFKLPLDSGGKEVIVVATDYKTYAVISIVPHGGEKPSRVLKLYSRTLEHNEKATEKFVEKAVEQGLSVSDVQLLTKDSDLTLGRSGFTVTVGDTRPWVGSSHCGRDGCRQAGSRCSLSLLPARAAQRLQAGLPPALLVSPLVPESPRQPQAGPSHAPPEWKVTTAAACLSSPGCLLP
ncbi:hypothetical protein AB1E18_009245 [Capra hircus]